MSKFVKNTDLWITVSLSIIFYLLIFTPKSLSPSNINLVMEGRDDVTQNYIGSALFRAEPLSWDLFSMQSLQYPYIGSPLQTDSNPLVSLIFKLLKPLGFKAEYQFFGIWILFNFMMSAVMSVLIFRHIFNKNNGLFQKRERWRNVLLITVSSVFFIVSPIVLNRAFYHVTLTAHWIILMAILTYLDNRLSLKTWLYIGLQLFITAGIHPYFLGMTLPIFAALVVKKMIKKEVRFKNVLLGAGGLCALLVCCYFIFYMGGEADRGGYGYYKANLNAFINPYRNESLFIKKMATFHGGENEGDNYLGLGLIILSVWATFYAIKHGRAYFSKHKELAVGCLLLTLFALSCNIHLGSLTILEYKFSPQVFEILRSSGRFLWPVWYLLAFGSIYLLTKKYKSKVALIIPILLVVQLIDLSPLFKAKKEVINNRSKTEYVNPLQSQEWDIILKEYPHIVLPPFNYWYDDKTIFMYYDFWLQALKPDVTVNTGHFSMEKRNNKIQTEKAVEEVKRGEIPVLGYKAVYIIPDDLYEEIESKALTDSTMKNFSLNIKTIDGVHNILCN
ncbi:MAG: DUF6311 domain-containing protein [Bacteroidales bacterium]|nr:DUF6311 domain-containing protein [Bacteroidales bacterium]